MTASRWFADTTKIPFGWVLYKRTTTGPDGAFYAYRPIKYLFNLLF